MPRTRIEGPVDRREHELRLSGVGALLSAGCYVLQPVLVVLVFPPGSPAEAEYVDVEGLSRQQWLAPLQALVFLGVGLGLALVVMGVRRLVHQERWSVMRDLGDLAGLVAVGSWLLLAGVTLAGSSSVALALAEAAPDPALQRGVLQGGSIIAWGFVSTAAIGFAVWLMSVAMVAHRLSVFGWPMTVLSWVCVAVVVLPMVIWSQGVGVLVMIPFFLTLGVHQLLGARRLQRLDALEGEPVG